jgi:acyl-CoA oxidase
MISMSVPSKPIVIFGLDIPHDFPLLLVRFSGYSSYACLSSMFNDFAVMCTWEGDNTVMAQQTARYLVKSAQKVEAGEKPSGASVAYLSRMHSILESKFCVKTKESLADTRVQMAMFEYCATRAIYDALMALQTRIQQGSSQERAWNDSSVELVECARLHCYKLMAQAFIEAYERIEEPNIRQILKQLCDLFVWHFLKLRIDVALVGNYITEGSQVHLIRVYIQELCESLREQAVPIVDAFNLSDFILRSPLGRYDGNVYTYYLDRVKRAPHAQDRAPYWEEAIRPIISRL